MSKILAVEFNDHSIKFMEGSRKGKILHVLKNGEVDLPVEIISDGMIKNLEKASDVLNKFLENSVKHRKVVFLINSNSVFIRKIELPYVKNSKETRSMINFKLQEMLPSYIYQYKIMYKASEIFMNRGARKAKYIVYGMPLKMYERYLDISEKLKLDLVTMDLSSNFIDYILKENTISDKTIKTNIIAVVNAGKSSMNLSIINKGITELFKIVEYNREGTLLFEQNCNDTLFKCIDEIRKYMKYYTSSDKDNVIGKIYLAGESVNDEFKESLSDFGSEIDIIEEMTGIDIDGLEVKEEFYNYLNLSASFYADKNHVDFLAEKKISQKYRFSVGVAVMSLVLIVALALSYNFLSLYFKTSMLENEASTKKMFLSNSDNILLNNEIENIKKKTVFLENYLNMAGEVVEKSRQDNLINSRLFEKIKGCTPVDTKINSFSADVNNVEINCESSSLKSVALFVENLRNIEFIDNVNMTNVEVKKEGEVSKYTYAVTCYLKGVDYEEQ
jgi:Tfp pilus assembly PilM family ATPase/Tfp pilus assembly protein PilN